MHRRTFLSGAVSVGAITAASGAMAAQSVDLAEVDPNEPRQVTLMTDLSPYEIHVDPSQFALFWTLPERQAIRYAIGVARPSLYEAGVFFVGGKRKWPSWTPTPAMIRREPNVYSRWAGGMPGGPSNPLGARALYLHTPSRGDTYLRIHGTNQPHTIGTRVSNGCARLVNRHVVDLYDRVPMNTRVVLYPA